MTTSKLSNPSRAILGLVVAVAAVSSTGCWGINSGSALNVFRILGLTPISRNALASGSSRFSRTVG
jgi:hypothetical protein